MLKERFAPVKTQASRKKRRNGDWAAYEEELTRLAEKPYLDLPVKAQERLANPAKNPQVSFGVAIHSQPGCAADSRVGILPATDSNAYFKPKHSPDRRG